MLGTLSDFVRIDINSNTYTDLHAHCKSDQYTFPDSHANSKSD